MPSNKGTGRDGGPYYPVSKAISLEVENYEHREFIMMKCIVEPGYTLSGWIAFYKSN